MNDSTDIRERVGYLAAKAAAAHERIDKLELGLREDLKLIQAELKAISAWMNRGKGWAAASMFFSSVVGGLITLAGRALFSK